MSDTLTLSFADIDEAQLDDILNTDGRGSHGVYPDTIRAVLSHVKDGGKGTSLAIAWKEANPKAKTRQNVIQGMGAAAKRLTSDGTFKGYRVKVLANPSDDMVTVYAGLPASK